MNKTPIEWTDFTVNPFRFRNLKTGKVGHHCTKISPGCKNCYSGTMQTGPYLSGLAFIEENKPKGEFFLDEQALEQVLRRKKPARIFWADMTDMGLEDYPDEWIDRCFAVMALTPWHTHQVLTKRAGRLREYMKTARERLSDRYETNVTVVRFAPLKGLKHLVQHFRSAAYDIPMPEMTWPLPNVWLGVSVEDRERKSRIDLLRETSAAVRFLSLEPLLEDLGTLDLRGIDWVIVGGESGPNARPMASAWARSIRDQCAIAKVPFFFKQWGEYCEWDQLPDETARQIDAAGDGNYSGAGRIGKKAAGAVLDGIEWRHMPAKRG